MNRNIIAFAGLGLCIFLFVGCRTSPQTNPTSEQKIDRIANSIRIGTGSAVAIGLVAIPKEEEAKAIAELARTTIEENILPILSGDQEVLVGTVVSLLDLKSFDNPKLEKVKLILQAALPLVNEFLPQDLLSKQTEKLPQQTKSYILAFFTGAKNGINDYLNDGTSDRSIKRIRYSELRVALKK